MKKELKTLGKRIAASALAIATAFVLIPFGGKEAKAEEKALDPVEITITEPVAGGSPVFFDFGGEDASEGTDSQFHAFVPAPTSDSYYDELLGWTDSSGTYLTKDDTFKEGETYTCYFWVNPLWVYNEEDPENSTAYSISEDTVVTLNGKKASVKKPITYEAMDGSTAYEAIIYEVSFKIAASSYTVTFESNGGSKIDAQEIEDGAKATKPTDPTKEGYTFDGWYSDKDLKTAFDFATAIEKDTTLYAKWTEKSTEAPTDDGEVSKESPATNAMPTVVSNSVEELKTLVLTDEDIAALEAGEDIKVYFAVTDIASTIDATEKAKVEEATKAVSADYSIGAYLDIDLFKQVGDKAAAGVTSTKGKMKVTITLPETLQGDYTYKAVRVHHATADVLDATYNATAKTLTFESDQFSTYAIIYKKAEAATTTEATTAAAAAATTTEATTAAKSSPKTGDSALPFVAFAILGLSALAGAYSLKKFAK